MKAFSKRNRRSIFLPLLSALASAVALACLGGCRKAEVEGNASTVAPVLSTGKPAYIIYAKQRPNEPWHREFQAVLDHKPATEKELDALIAEKKPALETAASRLMNEVRRAVAAKHKNGGKWSLVAMNVGRPKKGPDIQFTADAGLTKLFARRPVIAFNNVPLDLGIAKLARETGIQDSMPRSYNPRVYWTRNSVSAYEAIDEILKQHGYTYRFTDTYYRVSLRLQDYKTRADFVAAATGAILEKGRELDEARPALVVTLVEKPVEETHPETHPPTDAKSHAGAKPESAE